MTFRFLILIYFGFISLSSMAQYDGEMDEVYVKRLNNWQRNLTHWKIRNFVPLVGLHLLKEGENTFGKHPSNDIVINSRNAPDFMGVIIKDGKSIKYDSRGKINPTLSGKNVSEIEYTFDLDRNSERLRLKFIKWYVQFVSDDFFLRVMDEASPLVGAYEPPEYFPAKEEHIYRAKFKKFKKPKKQHLKNVIGTKQEHRFTGQVIFKHENQQYKLWVMEGNLLLFTDETNGKETFPFGRYLRVDIPANGKFWLDFNKSFSPPRASSNYTTCDLPPSRNHLPFRIEAGEKYEKPDEPIIRPVKR